MNLHNKTYMTYMQDNKPTLAALTGALLKYKNTSYIMHCIRYIVGYLMITDRSETHNGHSYHII